MIKSVAIMDDVDMEDQEPDLLVTNDDNDQYSEELLHKINRSFPYQSSFAAATNTTAAANGSHQPPLHSSFPSTSSPNPTKRRLDSSSSSSYYVQEPDEPKLKKHFVIQDEDKDIQDVFFLNHPDHQTPAEQSSGSSTINLQNPPAVMGPNFDFVLCDSSSAVLSQKPLPRQASLEVLIFEFENTAINFMTGVTESRTLSCSETGNEIAMNLHEDPDQGGNH